MYRKSYSMPAWNAVSMLTIMQTLQHFLKKPALPYNTTCTSLGSIALPDSLRTWTPGQRLPWKCQPKPAPRSPSCPWNCNRRPRIFACQPLRTSRATMRNSSKCRRVLCQNLNSIVAAHPKLLPVNGHQSLTLRWSPPSGHHPPIILHRLPHPNCRPVNRHRLVDLCQLPPGRLCPPEVLQCRPLCHSPQLPRQSLLWPAVLFARQRCLPPPRI